MFAICVYDRVVLSLLVRMTVEFPSVAVPAAEQYKDKVSNWTPDYLNVKRF